MAIDIQVKESYRGPMDLLLYLIKRDEVDIHDIPISHITNEYTKAISEMTDIDVDLSSEFLELASMLIEIKGRMLIPPEEVEEEEDAVDFDPRSDLVQALLEYKKFKEAAGELDEMYDLHNRRFPLVPHEHVKEEISEDTMLDSNIYELYAAFARMMRETIAAASATTIVATEVSTEECIEKITAKLEISERVSFKALFDGEPTRPAMVAFFIAILELIRLQKVHAMQSEDFGDIYLEKASPEDFVPGAENEDGILEGSTTLGEYVRKVAEIISMNHLDAQISCGRKTEAFLPLAHRNNSPTETRLPGDPLFKINTKKKTKQKKAFLPFPAGIRGMRNSNIIVKSNIIRLPEPDFSMQPHDSETDKEVSAANTTTEKSNISGVRLIIRTFLDIIPAAGKRKEIVQTKNIFQLFTSASRPRSEIKHSAVTLHSDPLFKAKAQKRLKKRKTALPFPEVIGILCSRKITVKSITLQPVETFSSENLSASKTTQSDLPPCTAAEKKSDGTIRVTVKAFPDNLSAGRRSAKLSQKINIFQTFSSAGRLIKGAKKSTHTRAAGSAFPGTPHKKTKQSVRKSSRTFL
ncbi:MAG: segregation and condensation protein A [Planctomycetota bacterium]|jgi:segregation and condensation protein A